MAYPNFLATAKSCCSALRNFGRQNFAQVSDHGRGMTCATHSATYGHAAATHGGQLFNVLRGNSTDRKMRRVWIMTNEIRHKPYAAWRAIRLELRCKDGAHPAHIGAFRDGGQRFGGIVRAGANQQICSCDFVPLYVHHTINYTVNFL